MAVDKAIAVKTESRAEHSKGRYAHINMKSYVQNTGIV